MIKYSTILRHFEDSPLWGYHIDVSSDTVVELLGENAKERRVICQINHVSGLHVAIMPNKGTWFIMLNKDLVKKIGISLGETVDVTLEKDESDYGMPMPEELLEVLMQNPDADQYFHELTAGKQRTLIYIVAKVKNVDSRIRKAMAIADHLTVNKGKIDFKLLNEAIKMYNNMDI